MKSKSLKLIFTTIFLLSFILSACSNSSSGNTTGEANEDEVVTLKLFSSHGQFNKGNYGERQIEEFMKAHPNIKVELTYAHGSNYDDTLLALASSGDLPDVFQPSSTYTLIDLLENKWVQPLDGLVGEDFQSRFPEGSFVDGINSSDGKIYTFPRIIPKRGTALYYHTDLMEEAGLDPNKPPKTWDELLDMSKQIREKIDGVYGFALPLNDAIGGNFVMRLAQGLQPTLDYTGFDYQKGQYSFDSPAVIKAVEFLLELKEAGVIHPNSPTQSLLDFQGLWANKQAAFGFNEHHFVRVSEFELDSVQDYSVAQIPVPEADMKFHQLAVSADFNAYISASTKHPKEAGMLVDWLSSTDYYQKQLKEDLLLSPLPDVKDSIENPQLEALAEVFEETVIARPIPESEKEAYKVKQIESTLAGPQPAFWQIVQGAFIGEIKDWKGELTNLNDALNKRFDQAIEKANSEGVEVSKDNFAYPDFDGTKDYNQNE